MPRDNGRTTPENPRGRDVARPTPTPTGRGAEASPPSDTAARRTREGVGERRFDNPATPPRAERDSGASGYPTREAPGGPGRVWQPRGETIDLSDARPTRVTRTPTLTGSASGPGSARYGLAQRSRSNGARGDDSRRAAGLSSSVGDGLVRLPSREITRETILQRYSGTRSADSGATRAPRDTAGKPDLSRTRAGQRNAVVDRQASARPGTSPTSEPVRKGSVEAARREREGVDRIERLRQRDPARAAVINSVGRRAAAASSIATSIAGGFGLGSGLYGSWFWSPTHSGFSHPNTHHGNAHGNSAWLWGSYYWGWPWWGHGYGYGAHSNYWGFYSYPSYGYGYYPYSYGYAYASPVYYSTVVYADDGSNGNAGVYEQPAAQSGEGAVAAAPEVGRVVQGEGERDNADTGSAKSRGTVQYLELGDDAFKRAEYSQAVYHYARAVEYSPDEGVLYLILSDALFATGDYHYAAYALRRAFELEPNLMSVIQKKDKHEFYGDPVQFDQQLEVAENYIREHILDDDARLVLAANYLFANRPAQSVDLLSSSFSKAVRESTAGRIILERAQAQRDGK